MRKTTLLAALLVALLAGACGESGPAPSSTEPPDETPKRIAVIPKGTTHTFWTAVEAGAKRAGDELGVDVLWKGPLRENDRAGQIEVVQQFISQGVDGICLAPLDHQALVRPVQEATGAGIPVVIFDSSLDGVAGDDFVCFVGTDNLQGGRLGGEHLAELVGAGGKVVLLRYQVGSASTEQREAGFLEAAGEAGLEILVDNRYAGATSGDAQNEALNMIDAIRAADGVFCSNESATMGMLLALRQAGLAGEVHFVGFDASPPLVQALRDGEIDALVVQDPRTMGYEAVRAMITHMAREPVEPNIDTGVVVVTPENIDEPQIQALLH